MPTLQLYNSSLVLVENFAGFFSIIWKRRAEEGLPYHYIQETEFLKGCCSACTTPVPPINSLLTLSPARLILQASLHPNTHFLLSWLFCSTTIITMSWCLKIKELVSFNIVSEAIYAYIFSGQKSIKNAKNGPFWRVFRKPEACGQAVLPDSSVCGKCQNSNATF